MGLAFGIYWIITLVTINWKSRVYSPPKVFFIVMLFAVILSVILMWTIVPETRNLKLTAIQMKLAKINRPTVQQERVDDDP